jgi:hypothetical protein
MSVSIGHRHLKVLDNLSLSLIGLRRQHTSKGLGRKLKDKE